MNKINILTATIAVAVLFFSCSGNKTEEIHQSHDHAEPAIPINPDTATVAPNQSVFFANIKDGDVLSNPVMVKFGVKGMKVLSVDSGVRENCGHHHLLIETIPFVNAGEMVPMGVASIQHFGKGQTETSLNLKPGKHSLSLQFADGFHRSYGVRMSKTVSFTVK